MNIKITKRDLKFFFIGVASLIMVDFAFNWQSHVEYFKKGYNEACCCPEDNEEF